MLKIISVVANDNFTLSVKLSNNKKGIFDVKPYLQKGVFTELQDINAFKKVKPLFNGIFWESGQDLSADTIEYKLQT